MIDAKRYDAIHLRYEDSNIRYGEGCEVEVVAAYDYDILKEELGKLHKWKAEQIAIISPLIDYARSLGECPLGASLTEWLVEDHKRMKAKTISNSDGFCGDPYVHDCGRTDCPTSDSFIKDKKQ